MSDPPPRSRVHRSEWFGRLLTGGAPRADHATLRAKRIAITGHRRVGLLRSIAGWILIVIGVIGIFMPMLPAVLFLPPGVALVGRNSRAIQWMRTRTKLLLRRAETWTGAAGRLGRWLATKERAVAKKMRARRMRKLAT